MGVCFFLIEYQRVDFCFDAESWRVICKMSIFIYMWVFIS